MCGRFVQAMSPQTYAEWFGAGLAVSESLDPSWNVAPTDQVYAVAEHDGARMLGTFRWGLIPWYADSAKAGARHINARAETLATKTAFKDSFARRRCIVPADGFYEWERLEDGSKLPHYVHGAGDGPLALAGLWAPWKDAEGERITTCTIVTTRPDELVGRIHDRMPVILPRTAWDRWLDPDEEDPAALRSLMVATGPGVLAEHAVSTLVNKVSNNYPECTAPLT